MFIVIDLSGFDGRWRFNVTASGTEALAKLKCYERSKGKNLKAVIQNATLHARPCPCTLAQAQMDNRYSLDSTLLKGYPAGGYLEIINNTEFDDFKSHCCADSKCNEIFYLLNPPDTCSSYRPPSWAPSWGDPHIKTIDGAEYTFNGLGDFTLLKTESGD
ncbi:MLP-like protein, partial [Mya arenaria]